MSAYIVSTTHIDALVTAMLELGSEGAAFRATCPDFIEEQRRAQYLGEVLIRANVAGVNARYQDSRPDVRAAMCGPADRFLPYVFRLVPWSSTLAPERRLARVLSALSAYEYQASDAPAWDDSRREDQPDALWSSLARQECDRLRERCCAELRKLLGAGDLWSIGEDDRNLYTVGAP